MAIRGRSVLLLTATLFAVIGVVVPTVGERGPRLLLGAFNVQIFGASKVSNPGVLEVIAQIISRYDILLLQEIRDIRATAVDVLLSRLNRDNPGLFRYVISERLGRSNSKEQYAFLFKPEKVIPTGVFQYSDPEDKFEREPFAVRFQSKVTEIGTFAVMGIHTSPKAADSELNALVRAYDDTAEALDIENVLIAGDFNADCAYVTGREWASVRLRTDPRFQWLIGDDIDTTVSATNCAYDRFVVAGDCLKAAIVPNSAIVYHFDAIMSLTPEQAKLVSDHYPIELEIRGKVPTHPTVNRSRHFSAETRLPSPNIPTILTSAMAALRQNSDIDVHILSGGRDDNFAVVVTLHNCANGFAQALRQYRRAYEELLPESLVDDIWESIWNTAVGGATANVQPWVRQQLARVRACALHYRMLPPFTCRLTVEQTVV